MSCRKRKEKPYRESKNCINVLSQNIFFFIRSGFMFSISTTVVDNSMLLCKISIWFQLTHTNHPWRKKQNKDCIFHNIHVGARLHHVIILDESMMMGGKNVISFRPWRRGEVTDNEYWPCLHSPSIWLLLTRGFTTERVVRFVASPKKCGGGRIGACFAKQSQATATMHSSTHIAI